MCDPNSSLSNGSIKSSDTRSLRLIQKLTRENKQKDREIEHLKHIINSMMVYLPGAVITHDMSTCENCGSAVPSGCITYCVKCMWKLAREAKRGR